MEMEKILRYIVELLENGIQSWCSTLWACS